MLRISVFIEFRLCWEGGERIWLIRGYVTRVNWVRAKYNVKLLIFSSTDSKHFQRNEFRHREKPIDWFVESEYDHGLYKKLHHTYYITGFRENRAKRNIRFDATIVVYLEYSGEVCNKTCAFLSFSLIFFLFQSLVWKRTYFSHTQKMHWMQNNEDL